MNALRLVIRCTAWLALTYLGYWAAVFVQSVFMQAVVYPALGSPVEDWQLNAFRAFFANGAPETLRFSTRTREVVVLVTQVLLLAFVLRYSKTQNHPLLQAWGLQAALWTVLLKAVDVALLGFMGRGNLGVFFGRVATSRNGRVGAAVVFTVLLLAVGSVVTRRLIAVSAHFWRGQPTSKWLSVTLLVLPVCVIVAGYFDFQFRLFGLRGLLFLGIPSGFSLVLALLGLIRKRPIALDSSSASVGFPLGARWALICILAAAGVYGGLAKAQRLESWSSERRLQTHTTPHYEIRYDPQAFSLEFVRHFSEDRERTFAALVSRLTDADRSLQKGFVDLVRIRIILYDDFARKRGATRSDHPYTVDGNTLRVVIHGSVQTLDPAANAAALLNATWGPPASPVIRDWVARQLAGSWDGETIENVAARLQWEEGHYPVERLLDVRRDSFLSPLLREPLGAAWIASLHATRGIEAVRKLYGHAPENPSLAAVAQVLAASPAQIESDWDLWTRNLAARQATVSRPVWKLDPAFFYRGVSFSHEGWGRRRGGYTGPEAQKQLELLLDMGVNAIAVLPYGFQQSQTSTVIFTSGADESDTELTQALFVAHRLGQKVMLKPQLWVGGGIFTGEIRLSDPAARAEWFRSYRAFILHYARLAEREGFDLLCIGNELGGLTQHAREWRELISQVRRVYHGPITYASNWGQEFESLSFWDELDYIGLNNYYPLRLTDASGAAQPVQAADLLSGAEKVARMVERISRKYARPVIFTEIGYPSLRGGTAEPWIEDRRRGSAPEEQAAAYEACFRVYSNKPWLRGMFWWKWPSNGRGGGELDVSFTPMRKPAAEVLRAWYERLAGGPRADWPGTP